MIPQNKWKQPDVNYVNPYLLSMYQMEQLINNVKILSLYSSIRFTGLHTSITKEIAINLKIIQLLFHPMIIILTALSVPYECNLVFSVD